jgi:hypothetical protein
MRYKSVQSISLAYLTEHSHEYDAAAELLLEHLPLFWHGCESQAVVAAEVGEITVVEAAVTAVVVVVAVALETAAVKGVG